MAVQSTSAKPAGRSAEEVRAQSVCVLLAPPGGDPSVGGARAQAAADVGERIGGAGNG